MAIYGIIILTTLLAVLIVLLVGLIVGFKMIKYGLDLGMKLNRYKETGQLIDEKDISTNQEMTE